jgi:Carboxypeptidase regulatory-like domain
MKLGSLSRRSASDSPRLHTGRMRSAALLLLTLPVLGVAQSRHTSPSLSGTITTSDGAPIPGAEIGLPELRRAVTSDSAGKFTFDSLPPGKFAVRVRRVGYRPVELAAVVDAGEAKTVRVALERGSQELPEVQVVGTQLKPIEYGWTTRYDDFFRRRSVGLGHFLTRTDIDKRRPFRTANLLEGIAGIRLRYYDLTPTGTGVEFQRCEQVSVWQDGRKLTTLDVAGDATRVLGELINQTIPSQIELVEVYTGPAEMPAEFLDNSCAAIVIWTR